MMKTWLATYDSAATLEVCQHAAQPHLSCARATTQVALFDGWLYNRAELVQLLGISPDLSNAEILLYAFKRWRHDLLGRLNGVFALCVCDGTQGSLLVARDPMGVRPLFYAQSGRRWFFSTSPQSLTCQAEVGGELNRPALAARLLTLFEDVQDATETFFKRVTRLLPGHKLLIREQQLRSERYWQPVEDWRDIKWKSQEDVDEELSGVLKRSLARTAQLGQAGLLLSGGLDSGMLATAATELSRESGAPKPIAISIDFSHKQKTPEDVHAQEARRQRGIAENLGLRQELIPATVPDLNDNLLVKTVNLSSTWPQPLITNSPFYPLTLAARVKALGCKVLLTGHGGDESFGVPFDLASDYLRGFNLAGFMRLWQILHRAYEAPHSAAAYNLFRVYGVKPLVKNGVAALANRLAPQWQTKRRARLMTARLPEWLSRDPELLAALNARVERVNAVPRTYYERFVIDELIEQPVVVDASELNFEVGRRTGIPVLEPFNDPEVFSFMLSVPPEVRACGMRQRGLQRRYLHAAHPDLGYDTHKKPFGTAYFNDALLKDLRLVWARLRENSALAELGLINRAAADRWVENAFGEIGQKSLATLQLLLCTEAWVHAHLRGAFNELDDLERR